MAMIEAKGTNDLLKIKTIKKNRKQGLIKP